MSDKKIIVTTSWDDGYPSDIKLINLLTKYDIKGTFYIPQVSERNVMSLNDIKNISTQYEIGAHTIHHTILKNSKDDVAIKEINESKIWIEDMTGSECKMFCFPRGRFLKKHISFLNDAGFKGARTVELLSTNLPTKCNNILLLPTTLQIFPHKKFSYLKNTFKRIQFNNFFKYYNILRAKDFIFTGEAMLKKLAESGGVFHIWGHSWEIDEYNLWANLEELLKIIKSFREKSIFMTNSELCDYAKTH